jgi:hypothetical protein
MKQKGKFRSKRWTKVLVASTLTLGMFITTLTPMKLPTVATEGKAEAATADIYQNRFLELWDEIHDSSNGYFSPQGIPYHSIETLMVEAPEMVM